MKKSFLDKLYGIRHSLQIAINESESCKIFPDDGYTDKVHDAREKELKSYLSTIDEIIEAYIELE